MRPQLVQWQWQGYPDFHGSRRNLLIHLVAVPAFVSSTVSAVWALVHGQWLFAAAAIGAMALAFAAQAVGHAGEKNPAVPFSGPGDAVARIFVEQFFNFPRFVLSGGWWKAFRSAR